MALHLNSLGKLTLGALLLRALLGGGSSRSSGPSLYPLAALLAGGLSYLSNASLALASLHALAAPLYLAYRGTLLAAHLTGLL